MKPLFLEVEPLAATTAKLTEKHSGLLGELSKDDVLGTSERLLASCKAWDTLAEAAREAVTFRTGNVKLLLSLIKVSHSFGFLSFYLTAFRSV